MAEDHLQLHGQPLGNGKEAGGGCVSLRVELKKTITEKNHQSKIFRGTSPRKAKLLVISVTPELGSS